MPRRKRRAKGTGSVYHRKGRGWIAQRELDATPEGKRRFERRFCGDGRAGEAAARRQAADWAAEALALAAHARAGDTVRAWCEHWLNVKRDVVSPRTLEFYARHVGYATAHIGDGRLLDLTAQHLRDMLAALAPAGEDAPGLSPRSRAHVRTVLRQAFQLAVDDGILTRNPVDAVEAPKVAKYDSYALSDTELRAFYGAVAGHRLRAMWHLLADLGPRHEEILVVRWSDLSREARTLRIKGTKTDEQRYLPLTADHLALLDAHWTAQQDERSNNPKWKEHGLIFPSEVGTKLGQSNVRRAFKGLLDGLNEAEATQAAEEGRVAREIIPRRVRIHDLRHTAATNLIAAGVDIPTVQYITGHRDSSVLLEIYAHAQAERNIEAVERVEQKRQRRTG